MKVQKRWNDEKYPKDLFEELSKKIKKKSTEVGLRKCRDIKYYGCNSFSYILGKYEWKHWQNSQRQVQDLRKIYVIQK
jgi:hypothetical protein